AVPWQFRLLFLAVMHLNKPIQLMSPGFVKSMRGTKRGTEAYKRKMHLYYQCLNVPDQRLLKVRHAFMQTDSTEEVRNREALKRTDVRIMQFQGEDELALNKAGTPISDQPYFGKYNLYAKEVEDIYPDASYQGDVPAKDGLIDERGEYKLLKLKADARMSRFALIPNSAHFNVIENPTACAAAIDDFINSLAPA
ncbi:MAG: hypothetical protein ACR2PJ_06910, partial [Pseudomonadales bacterium]